MMFRNVAVAISELIENESAYGETFHITTTESLSWEDVFKRYTSILSETTGKQFHIRYVDDIEMFYNIWNEENRKVSSRTKAGTAASSEVFGEWHCRTCQRIRHRAELQHD